MRLKTHTAKDIIWRVRSTIGYAGIGLISVIIVIFILRSVYGLSRTADIATIIALIIAGIAFVLFLWVHRVIGPKLELRIGDRAPGERDGLKWMFLHLQVINEPLVGWSEKRLHEIFRVYRRHATCQVRLSYLSSDEKQTYISPIFGDWSGTSEPFSFFYDSATSVVKAVPDFTKISNRWTFDVHPTWRGESVAVAIKYAGQRECYAFNAESYFGNATGKPWCIQKYRLDYEAIMVHAYLISGGIEIGPYRFRIVNDGNRIDENCFRLEECN
jgi:hypothetical protein